MATTALFAGPTACAAGFGATLRQSFQPVVHLVSDLAMFDFLSARSVSTHRVGDAGAAREGTQSGIAERGEIINQALFSPHLRSVACEDRGVGEHGVGGRGEGRRGVQRQHDTGIRAVDLL